MKTSLSALFVLASLFAFSGVVTADETMPAAKAEAHSPIHSVTCPDPCNFSVKSRDEKELVAIVKAHAKKFHKMALNDAKIKEMMKTE
jgi:predicted small metal-binding protein